MNRNPFTRTACICLLPDAEASCQMKVQPSLPPPLQLHRGVNTCGGVCTGRGPVVHDSRSIR